MLLERYYNGVEIHRADKIIYARFLSPHRVISTCRSSAGGLRDDLEYLYRHTGRYWDIPRQRLPRQRPSTCSPARLLWALVRNGRPDRVTRVSPPVVRQAHHRR